MLTQPSWETFEEIMENLSRTNRLRLNEEEPKELILPPLADKFTKRKVTASGKEKVETVVVKEPFIRVFRHNGREFQPPQYPRGKVLDTWTAQRCTMPLRSYEKQVRGPDGERHRGYRFDVHPREFGPPDPRKDASARFNECLDRHLENTMRVMHPRYVEQKRREQEKAAAKARRIAALRRQLESDGTELDSSNADTATMLPSGPSVKLSSRARHLHPFAYVNRHSRDISLDHPWQRIVEENQLKRCLHAKSF